MKFNVDVKARRAKALAKEREKVIAISNWHDKFAWVPTKVDVDEGDSHSFVWMEKYKRKWWRNPYEARDEWKNFSQKEFFKRKLNGEIKDETAFTDISHDGTDTFIEGTNSVSLQVSGADGEIQVFDESGHLIEKHIVTPAELSESAKRPATNTDTGGLK